MARNRDCAQNASAGVLSVTAFHEKAGWSQVGSFIFSLDKVFLFPPSSHCRHASIRTLEERLCSLGAGWAFSLQPVLPSDWRPVVLLFESGTWARPLTQSPELGFRLFDFPLPGTVLTFLRLSYAAAATVVRLLWCNGS